MNIKNWAIKSGLGAMVLALIVLPFASAIAANPNWNVTGNYVVTFTLGGDFAHDVSLTQDAAGNVTGTGGFPAGGPHTSTWHVTSGTVSGNDLSLTILYDTGTPGVVMHMTGTIASDGSLSGAWDDNAGGTVRNGTWTTTQKVKALHTITATAGANGVISPLGITKVTAGNNQAYTITPNAGFQVAVLTIDGAVVPDAVGHTFTAVTANHTIDVTFEAIPVVTHVVTATAGANGAISPLGSVNVVHGANQTFTITPNSNFRVANLTVDGVIVADATTYTFTNVIVNHTIDVTFEPIPPVTTFTITASAGANGAISPTGGVTVQSGANQTFTFTPNAGFRIHEVRVNGSNVATSTSFTFTNVTANHTIVVSFEDNRITPNTNVPTEKDQCKNGGWMRFTNPTFKNQGQCVNFVVSNKGNHHDDDDDEDCDKDDDGDHKQRGKGSKSDNRGHGNSHDDEDDDD